MATEKVVVQNINAPDHITRVDAAKYNAMKAAYLAVLPKNSPGITYAEAKAALLQSLPDEHFPGGKTSGWWLKCVQLDLEAKKIVARENTKPLRFYKL